MLLVSAVALVDIDGRVLLAQRPEGKSMAGLWEFPGGKIEAGETPEAALIRELREELPRLVGRDVVQVQVLGVAQPGAELRCPRIIVVLGVELFFGHVRGDDWGVVVVAAAFLVLLGFLLLLVFFVFVLFLVLLFLALAVLTAAGAV